MKDKIDFGSRVFRVEFVDKLMTEDGGVSKKLQGRISPDACLIEIESAGDTQTHMIVLWHEIIHFLIGRAGHDDNEFINPKLEEAMIENLSEGIMTVLRLNPWVGDVK